MKRHLRRLQQFLKDKNKKPLHIILKEVLLLWVKKGGFPLHYFGRMFYRKDAPKNFFDYLTLHQFNKVNAYVTYSNRKTPTIFSILDNKLMFYYFCKEHKIPSPEIYSYNLAGNFFFEGKVHYISCTETLINFFQNIMTGVGVKQLFLKPMQGNGGYGTLMLTHDKLNREANTILDLLKDQEYVHQKVIKQNEKMNAMGPNSINTIRLETYRDDTGQLHFLGSYMRFGHGQMIVDNASSGGYMVLVDIERGELRGSAARSLIYGTSRLTKHPDTSCNFEGFEIPYFSDIKEMVLNSSKMLPCRFHGWDVAISDDGPLFVEGNHSPGMLFSEQTYNGYKNKPIFAEIIRDANSHYKKQRNA